MPHESGTLESRLIWQSWQPESPKAVVLIAHGLAEHGGRYTHVADALTQAGYAVFAIDHAGHGQSPGKRGGVYDFNVFIEGMLELDRHARVALPGLPVTLLGHSMGGLIAALTALRDPDRFKTLVLSGPAVIAVDPPPAWQEAIVRFLARVAPGLGALALDSNEISCDPKVVQAYLDDPLVYNGKVPAGLVVAIFDAMADLRERAARLTLPLLVMHGSEDKLTAPEGSTLVHEQAGSADKTIRMWRGLKHEIFNEPEQAEVLAEMTEWLDARH
ncbi:MAG: lysophospholipase [Pseudomonadota bacterium]